MWKKIIFQFHTQAHSHTQIHKHTILTLTHSHTHTHTHTLFLVTYFKDSGDFTKKICNLDSKP